MSLLGYFASWVKTLCFEIPRETDSELRAVLAFAAVFNRADERWRLDCIIAPEAVQFEFIGE